MDQCDYCGSFNLTLLGVLGSTAHIRCKACGMNTNVPADELEIEDEPA